MIDKIKHGSYYEGLDGFRAVAVLLVMLVHYGYLNVGWIGVQMFFVLSGFLITNSLLLSKGKKLKPFLKEFYVKRFLRIFPLYFLYIFVFFAFSDGSYSNDFILSLCLFVSNLYSILNPSADFAYLGHYWSLAVEEQFYLLWPFIIYFLVPKKCGPQGNIIFGFFIILSPIIRYLVFRYYEHREEEGFALKTVNAFTLSHFDSFALGGLLSYLHLNKILLKRWRNNLYLLLVVVVIVGLINFYTQWKDGRAISTLTGFGFPYLLKYNYSYVYTLLNILFATIIVKIVSTSSYKILSHRYLGFIGKISFGMYVFHVLILNGLNSFIPISLFSSLNLVKLPLFLFLTVGCASISYYFFESYFLKLKSQL